ncbi:S24 family peptidase [Sphingobium xenophagum]|nr:S24 family peptidase [Sphingobium xenophagum]
METIPSIRAKLERLIAARGDSYASISLLIGRNPSYIQQFIKRGTPRKLDENDRRIIAQYFGVSEEMLGGGPTLTPTSTNRRRMPRVVAAPRLSLGASAGAGSLDEDECAVGVLAFDVQWLRRLGIQQQRASIIRVDGESMAPTLSDGDDIMVNHDDYASRLHDGVLMVKRIATGPLRRRVSVISDNVHYPNWTDIDPMLVEIVGRVVWHSRMMT